MPSLGVRFAVAIAVAGATIEDANAADACSIAAMVAAYKAGHSHFESQNFDEARRQWEPLAGQGFAPAQARVADLHARGLGGLAKSQTEAARWAILAAAGLDARGAQLAARLRSGLGDAAFNEAVEAVRAWAPAAGGCRNPLEGRATWIDGHMFRMGSAVVRIHNGLNENVRQQAFERLPAVIAAALRRFPPAHLYLAEIAVYEVVPGDLYDRYLGWKPDRAGKELQLTVGNLLDETTAVAAHAAMLEAAREVYRQLPGAQLLDPYMQMHKGKRLVGSLYPDIDNGPFFDLVAKALDMAEQLPADVRRHVEIIDEVRYNPQSKRMLSGGAADSILGYYDRRLSREGHRIIFVRREMKWSFLADVLLTLVHEGTHASQDQMALRYDRALPGKIGELDGLERAGQGSAAAATTLRKEVADMTEYVTLWYRRRPNTEQELQKRLRFECEATIHEIKTGQTVGLEPRAVEQTPYYKLCEDAKRAMVQWKDERLLDGLKRAKQP